MVAHHLQLIQHWALPLLPSETTLFSTTPPTSHIVLYKEVGLCKCLSSLFYRIQDSRLIYFVKNIYTCTVIIYKIKWTRRPSLRQVFVASTRATRYYNKKYF